MSELAGGQIGPEGNWSVSSENGKFKVQAGYKGSDAAGVEVGVFVAVAPLAYFEAGVKALESAIPGEIDNVILEAILASVKALVAVKVG